MNFTLFYILYILRYARKGYRVLGIAYKELDSSYNIVKIEKTPREKLEVDLIFLGIIISVFINISFQNISIS